MGIARHEGPKDVVHGLERSSREWRYTTDVYFKPLGLAIWLPQGVSTVVEQIRAGSYTLDCQVDARFFELGLTLADLARLAKRGKLPESLTSFDCLQPKDVFVVTLIEELPQAAMAVWGKEMQQSQ